MESPELSRSRLDPEPVPRRDLLGLASLWATASAFAVSLLGMLRLPRAAVLPSPTKGFSVQLPDNLAPGEAFVPPGRSVALFRDGAGVYAMSTICTHLGCVVKPNPEGFECPCHGSRFARDGEVTKGPAPRALDWLKVTRTDGAWFVDEDTIVEQGRREQA